MKNGSLLRGWKEIEAHLRLTRKTIVAHGFPVQDGPGGVWAYADELDRHQRERSRPVLPDIPANSRLFPAGV